MPVPAKFDKSQIVPLNEGVPQKFDTSQIQPLDSAPAATQPEKPGIISRAWQAANTPIADLSQRGRNESQKLEDVQSGPTSLADLKWRNEHPVQNVARQYLAGVEERASNLATPLAAATVGLGALPAEASAALNSIPGIAKVGSFLKAAVPVAFGAQGAQQVGQAATDDTLDPDTRLRMALGGAAAVTGAGASAAETFKGPMTKTLENVRKGAQSMVGAGERAVKTDVASTAESAGKKAKATEEANRAELSRHAKDVKEADQANTNAHVEYLSKKAEAQQANQGAEAAVNARSGLEKEVVNKSKQREAKIETAQKTAKADLDKRYDAQRELLGDELIPDTFVNGGIEKNALSSLNIGERAIDAYQGFITNPDPSLPPELKEIQSRAGEKLGWRELQGIRSKLSKKLSGGKLNGEVYQGYKAALGVVDDGLQKIADNMGVGDQVKKDRADYAHFMQTFHDSISEPNTVARKTQTSTSPDYVRSAEENERRGMLDVYDKSIGQLGQDIDSISRRLSALPSEGTRPKAETPKYPEGKEVTPPRTNPIDQPEVSTREIRERALDRWTAGESQLSKFQVRSLIGGGIGAVVGGLFEGKIGAGVGGMVGSAFGPAAIAKFVEMPVVREWLTRPPAGELETLQKLPYADRIKLTDGLKKVAVKAQSEGVKVNPAVLTVLGVSGGLPRTQQLQQLRDEQRQTTSQ